MDIRWDESKNRANRSKHGLSFEQGAQLLRSGQPILELFDDVYEGGEERYIAMGEVEALGVIVAVYADYGVHARLISVRYASPREIRAYQRERDREP